MESVSDEDSVQDDDVEEDHEHDLQMLVDVTKKFADIAIKKKQNIGFALQQQQEKLRDQLQHYKNARMERLMMIRTTHRYVIDIAAEYFGVDSDTVMSGVIDYARNIELLDSLFADGGRQGILFYYQEGDPPEMETGRMDSAGDNGQFKRIYVTDGNEIGLKGIAVAAFRSHTKVVETKHLHTDINFATIDVQHGNSISAFLWLLNLVYGPTVISMKDWGILEKTERGQSLKKDFIGDYKSFMKFIRQTKEDLDSGLHFPFDLEFYNENLIEPNAMKIAAVDREKLDQVEEVVFKWLKIIEKAFSNSKQLRRESDKVGPLAELAYWRRQLAQFMSIIEHKKSAECIMHIQCLMHGRSKLIKKWKEMDFQITEACNETKNIVKYLYALEKYCEPLYRCDPSKIPEYLPSLLYSVRMVYTTSRYFNTFEKVTALLVKITNRMTYNCRSFIDKDGTKIIWDYKKKDLLAKIKICLDLYSKYYQCFQHTKKMMEEAGEPPFGVSEMHVFLKFETFKRRLERIVDVLETTLKYSILENSVIENIDIFANKFKEFFKKISSQTYDPLDHRSDNFDKDYEEYKQNVVDTEWALEEFVGKSLGKLSSVDGVLRMLNRFDKLNLPCLHLEERYLEAMQMFQQEIGLVRDRYNTERQNPKLAYNMPPISGRIQWIRQLYKRISEPMEIFKKRERVIRHRKVQKCIQMYNSLACVFVHYEQIHHKAWYDDLQQIRSCLSVPVLIRHPQTKMNTVNFDYYILQALRETDYMLKFGLEIPDIGHVLNMCQHKLMRTHETVRYLVRDNLAVRKSIIPLFLPLVRPKLVQLENAFLPGFSKITWTSLRIEDFFENIKNNLLEVGRFIKEVTDLKEARIDEPLMSLAQVNLVNLPDEALYPPELLALNVQHRKHISRELELRSFTIERAVYELLKQFMDSITDPDLQEGKYDWMDKDTATQPVGSLSKLTGGDPYGAFKETDRSVKITLPYIHSMCNQLYAYFNSKITEGLMKSMKLSLERLKQRETVSSVVTDIAAKTLVKTKMELHIPNAIIVPSLDEIQIYFNQLMTNTLNTMNTVTMWAQRDFSSQEEIEFKFEEEPPVKTFYKTIYEHKEINRAIMGLQGLTIMLRSDIHNLCKHYLRYSYLWAETKEDDILEFVNKNPLIQEIREMFRFYDNRADEINNLPQSHSVGAVQVEMDRFKLALLVESNTWKYSLGKQLAAKYNEKLNEMVDFITTQEKILSKKITNLDDVRLAMACLEKIRDNFIEMDMSLELMEEAFAVFAEFKIAVSSQESERVDSLRYNFNNMLNHAKSVQEEICLVQGPFQAELIAGVIKFQEELLTFEHEYEFDGPMIPGLPASEASDRVLLFQARFDDLWAKYEMYSSGEKLFGMEINEYPILYAKKKEFNMLNKLYGLYIQVNASIDGYFDLLWSDLDIELIIEELTEFQNRCRKLPKGMKEWPAFIALKSKIDDFNDSCPLLEMMASKAMKERHWIRIENVTKYKFDIESPTFTLRSVMEAPLLTFKDDIEDICISANKEKDIEAKLKQVVAEWAIVDLKFALFKARGELLLKGQDTADIIAELEDSLMILNSLLSNRYNPPYKKEIQIWVQKLVSTSEILEKWLIVQNLWVYLEAVFVGGDISKQLPAESKRFNSIDRSWVKVMFRARDIVNAVETCTGDETMGQLLPYLLDQLETCQKSLTGYLESKRLCFPRFFFISDPVLLEILGQSSNPQSIQPHLLSLFDAVATVEFDEKKIDHINAMLSNLFERVEFEKPVICTGGVEVWLNTLLFTVRDTVKTFISVIATSIKDPEWDFVKNFPDFPGQGGLIGVQLLWTKEAEIALLKSRIDKTIMKRTNQRFLDLLNAFIDLTTRNLSEIDRTRFETIVTIHLHQRDIFDDLVRLRIKNRMDFEWQKQARFYWDEETDDIWIRITDVDFLYQNEYLGVTERLCITPLTDRCYITLAQAIGMNMGGAPAGPAGTGKTETTKDMGRALGKLVVVFNCSDQMDFRGLGRIFKGLAQSGSWGCFDEFNRIELPVLSVAAQQIYIVLTARKERKSMFIFSDGDHVSMNTEFGMFLTMNPGYAGRQELPENLKIMFRTVAMMVPDRQIIIRVKLASCGFKDNIILARKFFTLYKLCEEQLSKQVHYDFGLRNILSVLRTLGAQKRANPAETEETVVMRVLRDMNISKLVDEDEPLFMSLIEDMFPGILLSTSTYKEMQRAIEHQTAEMGIMNHAAWNLKVIQFYETSLVRHGLMILGPTGSGKTKCLHCLMKSLTECGLPHREMRMNPKAITAPQMFGRLDVATNDWTDGIFSTLWRRTLKVKKTEYVWLVLDGPVDAVWIENLNSVLDDNKTLTLANGDRIVMASNSKLCFEPDNVENASPATVSRMGMVFVSASVLKWQPMLDAWLLTVSAHEADVFRHLFYAIYDDLHTFLQVRLTAKMFILEALYIRQCIDVLTGLLQQDEEQRVFTDKHLERFFIFSLMWSLGAVLELDDREQMEAYVVKHPSKLDWPKVQEESTIFEYLVGDNGKWQHWIERVEEFIYPSDSILKYSSILVPNVDNVRSAFLMHLIAKQEKAVLFIGEQGTAKTVITKCYLAGYDPDYQLSKSINFSSETSPNMFQRIIESYVDKRVGTTYGPSGGKRMTVFIDDINMPIVNEWGDQITNEIVRQLMEGKGFFSLDKPGDFCFILDVQFLAAMNHPGGGRNDIPPRLKRQFCIFNCTLPSNKSMDKIFGQIAEGYFCLTRFNETIVEFLPCLIPLTRHVWQQTKIKMLPTPAKFHYVFNLRDLSRIWQGILTIQDLECQTISTLLKLWRHECIRVIADRFTNSEDTQWFLQNLKRQAAEELGPDFEHFSDEETYFVDFLREPPEPTGEEPEGFSFEPPKVYEELPNYEFVLEKVFSYMDQYNEYIRGGHMDMVFFHDALVNLMIISRIVRTPRGNALLVGVGGSGKQTLTRLASFMAGYVTFQITVTRIYSVSNLMEDLKFLYRSAGQKGVGTTFVFTDNEIKDESFLEFINNLIATGEIANLFAKDELDDIQTELIPAMKEDLPRTPATNDNLYEYFISRSKNNLHVVLCFSPVGEKFRSRALKFPGLISGCTMKWFASWPKDALIAVGKHYLDKFPIICTPEVKVQLIDMTGSVQNEVAQTCVVYFERFRRQAFVTPKSFLSFLTGYKQIYDDKLKGIQILAKRMSVGLGKLVEAGESVIMLKKDLEIKERDIAIANKEAEIVLHEVMVASEKANVVKEEANVVKERASVLVDIISRDQTEAETKLAVAKPALDAAEAALQTIKAADIATVRKLGKPPYLITLIMDCVLILFKKRIEPVKPDFERNFLTAAWPESLKVMADTRFLWNLQNYPKDTINAEIVDLLVPYFNYPLYTFENAKQACGNVAGLIQWTLSMAAFFEINRDVLPLKANLVLQTARYNQAKRELDAAMCLLAEKEAEVVECQERFERAMIRKKEVQEVADRCKAKMDAAQALIDGLSEERVRWTEQSAQFKSEIDRLVGDVLLLTGFLSYTGPFNQEFRTLLQKSWVQELIDRKIPVTMDLNISDSLIDNATIGEWNLNGLPTDELSIQNGLIVTKAARYPLLVDPQTQGKTWIRNMERENNLIVTTFNHKYFRNHVEDGVSLGFPLIIEDIGEELDPCLDNILEKNYIKIGTTYKVKLGDKEIDVHNDFRMYITTKLPNPAYTPEVSARTSIIDFTVTIKGLEDQLLGRVIVTEKNELERERTNLLTDVTANKRKMLELEQNLLYKLTTTTGSLVDDDTVIGVLNVTKNTAAEVRDKLEVAKVTEAKINIAREEFRPVATRGSVLYFLVVNMAMVNTLYQTSLAQFLERFDLSMVHAEKSPIVSRRIGYIIECMTYEIYTYKCRGLYEVHKYLFLLLMALKIDLQKEVVSHEEFQTFIKGGAALDLNTCAPKPAKWIMDMTWLNLVQLSTLGIFQFIVEEVGENDKNWKRWFDSDAPEEATIPNGYNNLDVFRRLLIVRSWCPDRTLSQSRKYIASSLGQKYVDPVILNMNILHEESRCTTPLICFLSMGSDPTPQIEQLAKKKETKCKPMSMGQGQEVHARKLLASAMEEGFWALLQNCHLGLGYMVEVLALMTDYDKIETMHPDFRLWLTTEGHDKFPISLLQLCIKFTNEPPAGIKAGLKRTYTSMNQDMLDYSDAWQYLPIIYAISFLHTVVQERRKFGPLGWNIPYEFNSADWLASCMFVQNHLEELEKDKGVSWVTVRYMLGEVQYGGRVTDDYDKRLLNTFAKVWFSESLFEPDFKFYKGYKIMSYRNLYEYLNEIETMSAIDPPQAYGLHPNADITYQTNTTTDMLFTIVSIQPKESSGGSGETREAFVARQTKDMLDKMPEIYDFYEVKERLIKMGILNSMTIFLRQEIDRMQRVIKNVEHTLKDLLLAIDGIIIMNEALRDALDNIYNARVPQIWLRGSWESSTLGFWFTELLERNAQFRTWCFTARPAAFWMTGFFNPQGFLTAMKQEVARAHKGWALDQISLHNDVTKLMKEDTRVPPLEGVYVWGLYLDGASWDRRNMKLCESINKVLYTIMPVMHIYAINSTDPKDPKLYEIPVYKKPNRTDLTFITPLWMPTFKPPDHWILRGVALLCDVK